MVDSRISRLQRKAARLNKLGIVSNDAMGRINGAMISSVKPESRKVPGVMRLNVETIRTSPGKIPENAIRATRNELQLSQRQFGAVVGKSETTIQRWETGKQKPKASSIRQIQKALQLQK